MSLRPSLYARIAPLVHLAAALALSACAASAPTPAAPTHAHEQQHQHGGAQASAHTHAEPASTPQRYSAVGRVRSIAPGRAFVSIAHEDVPGFMQAMTMDFEPTRAGQLDALRVGDAVRFAFTQTPDRRLLLDAIERLDEGAR